VKLRDMSELEYRRVTDMPAKVVETTRARIGDVATRLKQLQHRVNDEEARAVQGGKPVEEQKVVVQKIKREEEEVLVECDGNAYQHAYHTMRCEE
jgi:hypothetical protein